MPTLLSSAGRHHLLSRPQPTTGRGKSMPILSKGETMLVPEIEHFVRVTWYLIWRIDDCAHPTFEQ